MAKLEPKPGERLGGRAKGTPNKTTVLVKEAILKAAEAAGEDKQGKDGLVGYMTFLAKEEPKAFSTLLAKIIPTQVTGEDGGAIRTITRIELVAGVKRPD
jgi:hypothetical protein